MVLFHIGKNIRKYMKMTDFDSDDSYKLLYGATKF